MESLGQGATSGLAQQARCGKGQLGCLIHTGIRCLAEAFARVVQNFSSSARLLRDRALLVKNAVWTKVTPRPREILRKMANSFGTRKGEKTRVANDGIPAVPADGVATTTEPQETGQAFSLAEHATVEEVAEPSACSVATATATLTASVPEEGRNNSAGDETPGATPLLPAAAPEDTDEEPDESASSRTAAGRSRAMVAETYKPFPRAPLPLLPMHPSGPRAASMQEPTTTVPSPPTPQPAPATALVVFKHPSPPPTPVTVVHVYIPPSPRTTAARAFAEYTRTSSLPAPTPATALEVYSPPPSPTRTFAEYARTPSLPAPTPATALEVYSPPPSPATQATALVPSPPPPPGTTLMVDEAPPRPESTTEQPVLGVWLHFIPAVIMIMAVPCAVRAVWKVVRRQPRCLREGLIPGAPTTPSAGDGATPVAPPEPSPSGGDQEGLAAGSAGQAAGGEEGSEETCAGGEGDGRGEEVGEKKGDDAEGVEDGAASQGASEGEDEGEEKHGDKGDGAEDDAKTGSKKKKKKKKKGKNGGEAGQLETAPLLPPLRRSGLFNSKKDNLCCVNAALQLLRHTTLLRLALVALSRTQKSISGSADPTPQKQKKRKGGAKTKSKIDLGQLKRDAPLHLGTLFAEMEKAPKMNRIVPELRDYIFDNEDHGEQEDTNEIFMKLLDAVDVYSKDPKTGEKGATLKDAMAAMTHEMSTRLVCDCGGPARETKQEQQVLLVNMDPVADGEAPPGLGDLLDKVFARNEMGPCYMCEGRMKVAEKQESLLQSVGLELSNSSEDAWPETVVPIETAESSITLSILRQVLECFSPQLDGRTSSVRQAVEVAAESVKMILGEASLELMMDKMDKMGQLDECGKVDVAVALLLKAMLQRAEVMANNDEAKPAQEGVQQSSMVPSLKAMRDEAQRKVTSTSTQVQPHVQAKETRLGTLPNTIFVYLVRYTHDSDDSSTKINYHVDIPAVIDMLPYTAPSTTPESQPPETVLYDLDGVIHHRGERTDSGHFQTFVRTGREEWLIYDDNKVNKIGVGTVVNEKALMLAYTRRPPC